MDEQCLVLSGDWVCGDGGKWDFVIEKRRMGRMVAVYEGIGFQELKRNVLREFKMDEAQFSVTLATGHQQVWSLRLGLGPHRCWLLVMEV